MLNETELVQQLKNGSREALKECMKTHQNYVYSLLKSMLKNEETEEATQDTFIKVYRSIDSFNEESKFRTWLYRIAYRTGLDYLKKRRSMVSLDQDGIGYNLEVRDDSVQQTLEKNDLQKELVRSLNALKSEDAGLLRLFYFDEMSLKEITIISGFSESNVKVKLFRARKQLKEIIVRQKDSVFDDYIDL